MIPSATPARAMILAAGLGTRLRPLTDELPKPLVPVGDRPMVGHVAARLAEAGIREATLNTHHLAAAFAPAMLEALPLRLTVLHEPAILGTGGGVANAARLLGEGDAVIWNGDILADVNVAELLDAHRRVGAPATLAIAPRAAGEGTIGVGEDGEVVRLRGEEFGHEVAGGDFLGIQATTAAFRALLPGVGCLVGDGYLPALRRGATIATFVVSDGWEDVGTMAAYLAANARWLARTGRRAWAGEGVMLSSRVVLDGSVVGAGARVTGAGVLRGVVVWPGARAEAPLERAVVTRGGAVVRM